ncbi:MAG: CoB--CoM heterodisulfide reductase iron-sulfur subunit B family protein [Dehalococcoidia bacterium]|nr:CoB--CoM heterodisulfide reductase iron-sulfur subunit B family protein [Dehalococcoidia bacterium]
MNVSYFPGCSLDGTAREYGESVEAVFGALGVHLKELPDWTCCGSSSAHVKNEGLAHALPARNLEIASKIGMDLVVPCAMCFQRLKVAEKALLAGEKIEGISHKYEGNLQIKHVLDFLWEDVGEKAISPKVKTALTGLSPVCYYGCLTARPPKITDARNSENPIAMDRLLETLGAEVKGWSYKTDCCGGSLILSRPDIALRLTQKLFDMAEEAGANCIVTACPMCQSNLDMRQHEISQMSGKTYHVPVFFITELMGLAFGNPGAAKWLGRHTVDPRPLLRRHGLL